MRTLLIMILTAALCGCMSKSGRPVQNVNADAMLLPPEVIANYHEEIAYSPSEAPGSDRVIIEDQASFWRLRKVVAIPQPDGSHHFRLSERNSVIFSPLWNEETVSLFDGNGRRLSRHNNGGVLFWLLYDHRSTELTMPGGYTERFSDSGVLLNLVRTRQNVTDHELRLFWLFPFRKTVPQNY